MSDEKKPAAPAAAPTAAQPDPEGAAKVRIEELQKEIRAIKQEVVNMHGKVLNLDPALAQKLEAKNGELKKRRDSLMKALYALHEDEVKARSAEDEKLTAEILRLAAVEHFKKSNVDPQLWKSLES